MGVVLMEHNKTAPAHLSATLPDWDTLPDITKNRIIQIYEEDYNDGGMGTNT